MSEIPAELKYTDSHEWIREDEGGIATIGITDHAQEQLGDLVFIELPEVGSTLSSGDACCVVESVKAASDVYSPLSGEVVEVNELLNDAPETINDSPYDDGWLFKIKMAAETELDDLLDAEAYEAEAED